MTDTPSQPSTGVEGLKAALEEVRDWIKTCLPPGTYAATTMLGRVQEALAAWNRRAATGEVDEFVICECGETDCVARVEIHSPAAQPEGRAGFPGFPASRPARAGAPPQPATGGGEDVRPAFERWAVTNPFWPPEALSRRHGGGSPHQSDPYKSDSLDMAWRGWEAAHTAQAERIAALEAERDALKLQAESAEAERDKLREEGRAAYYELSCCDDIPLGQGLAAGISALQADRERLRAEINTNEDAMSDFMSVQHALEAAEARAVAAEKFSYEGILAESAECAALRSHLAAAKAEARADKVRLNWLEHMDVNVRAPLVHGSRDLFWASPDQEEGQDEPSDIRRRIDAALAALEGAER